MTQQTLAVLEPPQAQRNDLVLMFERLATDPAVDVAKLERLIELQRSIIAANAKAEFDAAFAQMQGELPIIAEKGRIVVREELRSKYARYEDVIEGVRPVLARHGFSIRHQNSVDSNRVKVVGILSHRSGHSEQDEFVAAPDDSGGKASIQAVGSTRSYGQRYTTLSLLGIATRDMDDDGQAAVRKEEPKDPDGFEDWWMKLAMSSDNGWPALSREWEASPALFKNHAVKKHAQGWASLKAKANDVTARARK